jgi:hypothetical protein
VALRAIGQHAREIVCIPRMSAGLFTLPRKPDADRILAFAAGKLALTDQ